MSRDAALQRLRASTVFTTHTPVPAGNEVFDAWLVQRNVASLIERCGFTWDEFVAMGRLAPGESGFGLTPFALRTSTYANGVSDHATPVSELIRLIGASGATLAETLTRAVPKIDADALEPVGTHFRFD